MPRTIFFKKIENENAILAQTNFIPTNEQLNEESEILRYGAFNHLTVFNLSTKDAEVRLYGENISDKEVEFLAASSALIFDHLDNLSFTKPVVFNRHASESIAAKEIIMQIRKVE